MRTARGQALERHVRQEQDGRRTLAPAQGLRIRKNIIAGKKIKGTLDSEKRTPRGRKNVIMKRTLDDDNVKIKKRSLDNKREFPIIREGQQNEGFGWNE